jgi:hypothetical protein
MSFKPSVHWLLAAIPVAAVLDGMSAPAPLVFFSAALAIVPLAALIVHGTETHLLSHSRGDVLPDPVRSRGGAMSSVPPRSYSHPAS